MSLPPATEQSENGASRGPGIVIFSPDEPPDEPEAHGLKRPAADLLPAVYAELRRHAAVLTARLTPGQTLQPTALVHEAYLRLVRGQDRRRISSASSPGGTRRWWPGRRHLRGAPAGHRRVDPLRLARCGERPRGRGDARVANEREAAATFESYRARIAAAVAALLHHDVADATRQLDAAPPALATGSGGTCGPGSTAAPPCSWPSPESPSP